LSDILKFVKVNAGYKTKNVLKNIDFSAEKGAFLGIIGPNGSGKSTFLKTASGVLKPLSGRVLFAGSDISKIKAGDLSRNIAFVGQYISYGFSFTVRELVLMGRIPYLKYFRDYSALDKKKTDDIIGLLNLTDLKDRYITELSAGEQQRVMIAKALAQEPRLLLLDEPTAHLDIGNQIRILDIIKKLNKETGLSVLGAFHDLNIASEFCDKLLLISDNRIIKDGASEDVLRKDIIEKTYKVKTQSVKNPYSGKNIILPKAKDDGP
jgi:iron complex transport system ATP-binding protein